MAGDVAATEVGVVAAERDASAPHAVEVRGVERRFGDVTAVAGVDLLIERGAFVSLLGPSGCGKTTLLRVIAGLERQDAGTVAIDGRDVTHVPPHRRPMNLVFQRYALFPHKTVGDNVAFPLMLRRVGAAEIATRVRRMLELVQLPGYERRAVTQLSGGQAQRVALARALVDEPPVLLLDEPLAALDLKLRQAMHVELREIQRRVDATFVYVTHDQQEAFALSDRVVLMNDGRIIQDGTPLEVYHQPRTLFAAGFLGEANVFHGEARATAGALELRSPGATFLLPETTSPATGGPAAVCLRPEAISIAPVTGEPAGPNAALGEVLDTVFLGNIVRYRVAVADRTVLVEIAAEQVGSPLRPRTAVRLSWSPTSAVLLEG